MLAGILIAVGVITALTVFLAVLLIVADALLLNYGEVTVTVNKDRELKVEGGNSLLATLMDQGIFIASACGGRGSCGLCKVKVLEGGGPLLPTETPHLSKEEIEDHQRLSCQCKVRGNVAIEVPESVLSVRQYTATAEKLVDLNYDTRLLRLKLKEPDEISFKAGQYVQLETRPYGKAPEPVYRAYSVASATSDKGAVELIIRRVPNGICTTFVFEVLKEGEEVRLNGPYGEFYLRDTEAEAVFIAGGSGIAPIRSILFRMAEEKIARKAAFFYGGNEQRDLYLVDEMREFEKKLPDFRYVPVVARPKPEDRWEGETGFVTQALERQLSDASKMEGYLCGPPGMIDAAIKVLTAKGMPQDKIYFDKFA